MPEKILILATAFICFLAFPGCEKEPEVEVEVAIPNLWVAEIILVEKDANYVIDIEISVSDTVETDITLDLRTISGTADETDFVPLETTVSILKGAVKGYAQLTIIGDEVPEKHETFEVEIYNPVNANIPRGKSLITIINDDVDGLQVPENGYQSATSYPGRELIWEEQFDGLNPNVWNFDIGDGCEQNLCGWGNNELQYYQEDNLAITDGYLVIEARKEEVEGMDYTSTRINTKGKRSFQYGRIDIRAVAPKGQGMWPALWMLGNNIDQVSWPACGEIDIMEMVGGDTTDNVVHGTLHWDNAGSYAGYGGSKALEEGILNDAFHVYSIDWNADRIQFYIDDFLYHQMSISSAELSEFRNQFYFIINLAVGGNWPGWPDDTTEFPQWFIVDYIRVFR